jgi:hypothetical protein
MNLYAIVMGAVVACVAVLLFKAWGLDKTQWAYPVLLAEFPVNYWAFAIYGSDPAALREEVVVGLIFLSIAYVAYRFKSFAALLFLAFGYVMHAAYDFSHDFFFVNAGAPRWWPEFCASVDILIGVYIAYLAFSFRKKPNVT